MKDQQTTKPQDIEQTKPLNRFKVKAGDTCPECEDGKMRPESGCICCPSCGWGPCTG